METAVYLRVSAFICGYQSAMRCVGAFTAEIACQESSGLGG
jgi:hypothetical protein